MISFRVDDMTCGHCVATITRAVQAADPQARVAADLGSHRVSIEPGVTDAAQLARVIGEAGYTPVAVASDVAAPLPAAKGCCGHCH